MLQKILIVFSLCSCSINFATSIEQVDLSITIYNQNFAVVHDVRYLNLKKGLNIIEFSEIPQKIERESLHFKSISAPGSCWIQEQDFKYDVIDTSLLLKNHLNKEIQILDKNNQIFSGILLNYSPKEIILKGKDERVIAINRENIISIKFSKMQKELITKPTLIWKIISEKEEKHKILISYLTEGLNWKAQYKAILSPKEDSLNLNGWITLDNNSGIDYFNATLKLVAGEIKREKQQVIPRTKASEVKALSEEALLPEFEQKEFFEYYIYTLPWKTSINHAQQKQILFLTSENIPIEKIYTFESPATHWWYDRKIEKLFRTPIKITLKFKNDKKHNLGKPLPAGIVKVFKENTTGLEFIGEDSITHTPESEEVKLYAGNAFDIIGEKKHLEYRQISYNTYENTYKIEIRNHKKEEVKVLVMEPLFGDWEIIKTNHEYRKTAAHTIEFSLKLPPNSSHFIVYTVRSKI